MPALADEIARLSKENATLRSQAQPTDAGSIFQGLTYDQMRLLIESKSLLDILFENRVRLNGYTKHPQNLWDAFAELSRLGLLRESGSGDNGYFLYTDQGKAFVNRLEFDWAVSNQKTK